MELRYNCPSSNLVNWWSALLQQRFRAASSEPEPQRPIGIVTRVKPPRTVSGAPIIVSALKSFDRGMTNVTLVSLRTA